MLAEESVNQAKSIILTLFQSFYKEEPNIEPKNTVLVDFELRTSKSP